LAKEKSRGVISFYFNWRNGFECGAQSKSHFVTETDGAFYSAFESK
jgi:hypothetical protein